jgi:hypothetical protein
MDALTKVRKFSDFLLLDPSWRRVPEREGEDRPSRDGP